MRLSLSRWEIRALGRERAFWIALALAIIVGTFALINGHAWLSQLRELGASAQAIETRLVEKSRTLAERLDRAPDPLITPTRDPRNPYGYAHFQMQHFIALPPTPLATLSVGQSDVLPQTLSLTPGTPPSLLGTAEPENPHRLLIGPFDASFVIVYLLPLLVIALTYGLIATERERGTLPLLVSQPIALRTLVLGRLLPRVLLVALLLGALAVAFSASTSSGGGSRLLIWLAIAGAYAVFWFALSLLIVTRRGSAAVHALVLSALWLALVVLAPAGINLTVKTLKPVPSRIELILALRSATDEISAQTSRLLADYYEDHPEFAPKSGAATEFSEIRFITNEQLDRKLAPVLARYEGQLADQQRLVEKLQFLSPALLAHSALADAAGTGLERHRAFMRQAAKHHQALREFFNPRILRKERFDAWDQVPVFHFAEESAAQTARRASFAVFALLALALPLAFYASLALRRPHLNS